MDELMSLHTPWDVLSEHCGLFVSFGGVPHKNSQINAGGATLHHVKAGLFAMREKGVRFVNVTPTAEAMFYAAEARGHALLGDSRTFAAVAAQAADAMERSDPEQDPAWIAHHFEWKRGSGGADRLVERARFTPLPYYGTVSTETNGDRTYRIEKGSDSLRTALVAFLVARFQAEPQPADSDEYEFPVKIGDKELKVAHSSGFGRSAQRSRVPWPAPNRHRFRSGHRMDGRSASSPIRN